MPQVSPIITSVPHHRCFSDGLLAVPHPLAYNPPGLEKLRRNPESSLSIAERVNGIARLDKLRLYLSERDEVSKSTRLSAFADVKPDAVKQLKW